MFVYTNIGHFSRKDVIMAKVVFACDCIVTIALLAVDLLKIDRNTWNVNFVSVIGFIQFHIIGLIGVFGPQNGHN